MQLSLKFPADVAENNSPNDELSGERCCAAFQTAAAVSSSAEEDDWLCHSDLGATMKLSRIVSFMLWLAKANKEEGGLADSVLPVLGREEKGSGK